MGFLGWNLAWKFEIWSCWLSSNQLEALGAARTDVPWDRGTQRWGGGSGWPVGLTGSITPKPPLLCSAGSSSAWDLWKEREVRSPDDLSWGNTAWDNEEVLLEDAEEQLHLLPAGKGWDWYHRGCWCHLCFSSCLHPTQGSSEEQKVEGFHLRTLPVCL